MFGIAKTHFSQALRANHLVYAEFRSHFIPSRSWRWGLLVFTAAVLGLALMGWLTSTTAHGQVEAGLPWELDVVARAHVPSDALGMQPTFVEDRGIDATWTPRFGTEFGLRIHRRLRRDGPWEAASSGFGGSMVSWWVTPTTRWASPRSTRCRRCEVWHTGFLCSRAFACPWVTTIWRFKRVGGSGWSGRPARR